MPLTRDFKETVRARARERKRKLYELCEQNVWPKRKT